MENTTIIEPGKRVVVYNGVTQIMFIAAQENEHAVTTPYSVKVEEVTQEFDQFLTTLINPDEEF